jgi:hypothetical protein
MRAFHPTFIVYAIHGMIKKQNDHAHPQKHAQTPKKTHDKQRFGRTHQKHKQTSVCVSTTFQHPIFFAFFSIFFFEHITALRRGVIYLCAPGQ